MDKTPKMRRTCKKASLYELTKIIAIRTLHIEQGHPTYVDYLGSPEDIAIEEIRQKKSPLGVLREINGDLEEWSINELVVDFNELVS